MSAANALKKADDKLHLILSLPDTIKNISNSDTIIYTRLVISEHPDIKSLELGQFLSEHYSRKWTITSKKRYGNALMNWVKYLDSSSLK